jgi:glutathione S-transferase
VSGYTLYGWRQTGSLAVEAALREAGADFEVIEVDTSKKEHWNDTFRAINPRQQVPALILPDDTVVTECAAILLHLADAFPAAKLAPAPGSSARALHDRWLIFLAANVYEGELRKAYPDRYTADENGAAAVASAAELYVQRHYAIFEEQINAGPYFFGSQITMLDIYLWLLVQWMDQAWLAAHCPKVLALANAVKARPVTGQVQFAHFGAP